MQNLMPQVDTPDNLFHDGDPTKGIEGTIVTAKFMNDDQSAIRDTQQELLMCWPLRKWSRTRQNRTSW